MEIYQVVGQNIQRIRKGQKLSIDRAAELAGISKSMLGQIERGSVNPTISVLHKLSRGLHVPLEALLEHEEDVSATLYRGVDTAGQRLCGGKVIRYPLFPYDANSRSESYQLDIFITGEYALQDRIPGSRVYLTVLSGTVEVEAAGEKFMLAQRDCLLLPGDAAQRYVNKSNITARMIQRIVYKK